MKIIQTQMYIDHNHPLTIALPHDLPEGNYQIAIVLNPQPPEQTAIVPEENSDFFASAGIWEGKNITQDTIRKNAWGEENL
jgi:hypothetical protein